MGRGVLRLPRERGELATAKLLVTVAEGRPTDGALPPGDASHTDSPHAADDCDIRIAERLSHPRSEVGLDYLDVLVDEDERLEILVDSRLIEQQVVVPKQRGAGHLVCQDHRVRLRGPTDPRCGDALVGLRLCDRNAE